MTDVKEELNTDPAIQLKRKTLKEEFSTKPIISGAHVPNTFCDEAIQGIREDLPRKKAQLSVQYTDEDQSIAAHVGDKNMSEGLVRDSFYWVDKKGAKRRLANRLRENLENEIMEDNEEVTLNQEEGLDEEETGELTDLKIIYLYFRNLPLLLCLSSCR